MSKHNDYIEWLHISDLHVKETMDRVLMEEEYAVMRKNIDPDFIVVSGDLRDIGSGIGFQDVEKFLEKICDIFQVKKTNVFLVPGNHDVTDSEERKKAIGETKENIEKKDITGLLKKSGIEIERDFKEYIEFVKKFYGDSVADDRKNNPAGVVSILWEQSVKIVLLNSALISDGNRNHYEVVDVEALNEIDYSGTEPIFILAHHDINSIHPNLKKDIDRLFRLHPNIVAWLCGDSHRSDLDGNNSESSNLSVPCIVCGKSIANDADSYSGFGIMQYTMKYDGICTIKQYDWTSEKGFKNIGQFRDICLLPRNQNLIQIKKTYPNIFNAHDDIARDIKDGWGVDFFGLRGATFCALGDGNKITSVLEHCKNR